MFHKCSATRSDSGTPTKDKIKMARIGLIDVDGRNFPNIPLMKLSAFHKAQGDFVEWYMPFGERYDIVYMSKVFSFTPDFKDAINADKVVKGGTGYAIHLENGKEVYRPELDRPLSPEVEHVYPDYSLYPRLTKDTAYGFLTRGCPRGCEFCIAGKKEGLCSRKVADLSEFWRGQKRIVLCDPNILACPDWRDLIAQLKASGAGIDFNQGLDIRLMTEDKAKAIADLRIKEIHFAWDRYEDRDIILPRLKLYADIAIHRPHSHIAIVYTIVNFNTTLDQDLDRIYTLRDMGYWPYVMVYNKANAPKVYARLQGWVNNRIIFAVTKRFEDYDRTK